MGRYDGLLEGNHEVLNGLKEGIGLYYDDLPLGSKLCSQPKNDLGWSLDSTEVANSLREEEYRTNFMSSTLRATGKRLSGDLR